MEDSSQSSIWNTVFLSFTYGFGGFVVTVNHFGAKALYEHDFLSYWFLAPLGSFFGFIGAACIHEFAHFFATKSVGGYVHRIQIGSGRLLKTFSIMGTTCDIRESLRSGFLAYNLTSSHRARTKLAMIMGSAPLASVLFFFVSISFLICLWPVDQSVLPIRHYLFPLLLGWTVSCATPLPGVLLPFRYHYAGREMETDMLRLLTIPGMTDAEVEKTVSSLQTCLTIRKEVDPGTTSLEEALKRADEAPNSQLAVSTAAAFLREARDPRVLTFYKRLVTLFPASPERVQFLDQYLTCCLEMGAVFDNSEEMNELSGELVSVRPSDVSTYGTRGSILIDIGRIEEGKIMLNDVLAKTESLIDKTYSNIFLALAEKQKGNLRSAREHASKAADLDPQCAALKRVADLLDLNVKTLPN